MKPSPTTPAGSTKTFVSYPLGSLICTGDIFLAGFRIEYAARGMFGTVSLPLKNCASYLLNTLPLYDWLSRFILAYSMALPIPSCS